MSTTLYRAWLDALAQRDQVILSLALVASLSVLWLCYGRWLWPRALKAMRVLILVVFFGSLVVTGLVFISESKDDHPLPGVVQVDGEDVSGLGRAAGAGPASDWIRR